MNLAGGVGGTNPSGGIGGAGGNGLLKLDGVLQLNITSASLYQHIDLTGSFDPSGGVHFTFASEATADSFASSFTLDNLFSESGGPVANFAAFQALDFSASSPTRQFDVVLNANHSFTLIAVPEPSSLAMAGTALVILSTRRLRRKSA